MLIATKSSKFDISAESFAASIAKKLATFLKNSDVVFLYGEIGVGKTTFVRHLINNIQIKNNVKLSEVTSPTFNIVNQYEVKNLLIQHYDLFRLKNSNESKNIGLFEDSANVITLIEWPEKIEKKPLNTIDLIFEYDQDIKKRFLTIKGLSKEKLNEIR